MNKDKLISFCILGLFGIMNTIVCCNVSAKTAEDYMNDLYSSDAQTVEKAVEYFCESNGLDRETAIPSFIEILLKERKENLRERATNILSCFRDPKAIPLLSEVLQNDDASSRLYAARVLGTIIRYAGKEERQAAVPVLINDLDDSDSRVRTWAASSLGYIGDSTVIPKLIERVKDEDSYVRRSSIRALGKIGETSVLPVLLGALDDEEHELRRAAVDALGELNDPVVVAPLIKALSDPEGTVRWEAADVLGELSAAEAIPHLQKLAADDPYSREISARKAETRGFDEERDGKYFVFPVRRAAREALESLEAQSATDITTPSPVPTEEPRIKTVPPSPVPAERSPVQAERQIPPESESLQRGMTVRETGVLAFIVLLVLCTIGFLLYRIKSKKR